MIYERVRRERIGGLDEAGVVRVGGRDREVERKREEVNNPFYQLHGGMAEGEKERDGSSAQAASVGRQIEFDDESRLFSFYPSPEFKN